MEAGGAEGGIGGENVGSHHKTEEVEGAAEACDMVEDGSTAMVPFSYARHAPHTPPLLCVACVFRSDAGYVSWNHASASLWIPRHSRSACLFLVAECCGFNSSGSAEKRAATPHHHLQNSVTPASALVSGRAPMNWIHTWNCLLGRACGGLQ